MNMEWRPKIIITPKTIFYTVTGFCSVIAVIITMLATGGKIISKGTQHYDIINGRISSLEATRELRNGQIADIQLKMSGVNDKIEIVKEKAITNEATQVQILAQLNKVQDMLTAVVMHDKTVENSVYEKKLLHPAEY